MKSANKLCEIHLSVEPIDNHGLLEQLSYLHPNAQYLAKHMIELHGWKPEDAQNIKCIHNENVLVNKVKGISSVFFNVFI